MSGTAGSSAVLAMFASPRSSRLHADLAAASPGAAVYGGTQSAMERPCGMQQQGPERQDQVLHELHRLANSLPSVFAAHSLPDAVQPEGSPPAVPLLGHPPQTLLSATQGGMRETVRQLLLVRADARCTDGEGRTPLHIAAADGQTATCSLLLTIGGLRAQGLEMRTASGITALHLAAQSGHGEVCGLLLGASAEPAAIAPEGRTALHLASMAGHEAAVMCLLAVTPESVQWEDDRGLRALYYARLRGFPEVAEALEAEEEAQKALYVQWWQRFEPDTRAALSLSRSEAFLEVDRPWLLGAGASAIRLGCRVVDSLGLLKRFLVDLRCASALRSMDSDSQDCTVRIPAYLVKHPGETRRRRGNHGRHRRNWICDRPDVELKISLARALEVSAGRLGDLYVRVVGEVDERAASRVGVACQEVRSPWVCPVQVAGSPVTSLARGLPARR